MSYLKDLNSSLEHLEKQAHLQKTSSMLSMATKFLKSPMRAGAVIGAAGGALNADPSQGESKMEGALKGSVIGGGIGWGAGKLYRRYKYLSPSQALPTAASTYTPSSSAAKATRANFSSSPAAANGSLRNNMVQNVNAYDDRTAFQKIKETMGGKPKPITPNTDFSDILGGNRGPSSANNSYSDI